MEYFFQRLIRWKFTIVVAYVSQVGKFKERFPRRPGFSKLEGFRLLPQIKDCSNGNQNWSHLPHMHISL
jgi:hypothetical protein